jgi:hypothetical protein
MDEVDNVAIECVKIGPLGTRNDVYLREKDSLLRISLIRNQPILKCEKQYMVVDGAGTAYIYEEEQLSHVE